MTKMQSGSTLRSISEGTVLVDFLKASQHALDQEHRSARSQKQQPHRQPGVDATIASGWSPRGRSESRAPRPSPGGPRNGGGHQSDEMRMRVVYETKTERNAAKRRRQARS